ncbi:IPT/TIG domain-containing protein [Reichenbachiella agariperforans]|uniref:IPT/TIG domain-containing protein n=2 Tax=Reichenbachiella agariperforans TaxID=156994 RepID=A0A1M6RIB0_REIAG|nr:IPT/TIG domain-containing protein [Reichenbachiella agariperforans]
MKSNNKSTYTRTMKNYTGIVTATMLAVLITMVTLISSCKEDEGGEVPGGGELTITAIDPAKARIGEQVTITGTGFNPDYSQNEVKFYAGDDLTGGEATKIYETATLIKGTATSLVVEVPAKAQDGHIIVMANGEELESSMDFVVDTSIGNPVLTSLSPTNGYPGAEVVITGENFGESVEAIEVKFDEVVATISEVTNTTITTAVPEGMTEGEVQVNVSREGTAADKTLSYTVNKIPVDVKTAYWTATDGIYRGIISESGVIIIRLYADADENFGSANGIEVDVDGGQIYFSDQSNIFKAPINGEGPVELLYEGISSTGDIAIDKVSESVYFTARDSFKPVLTTNSYIIKGSLDGTQSLDTLYVFDRDFNPSSNQHEGPSPVSPKLYVANNKLYWTDRGKTLGVWEGSLDGTVEAKVLFDATDGLVGPSGITFDRESSKLFIADNGLSSGLESTIYVGNLNGEGDLETLVGPGDNVRAPSDMEIDTENGFVFWLNVTNENEMGETELNRASLDGEIVEVLFDDFNFANYFDLEIGEVLPE